MEENVLSNLLKNNTTAVKNGIFVASEIAETTVWDELAGKNPTHAVISANDEAGVKAKSEAQIADIKRHVKESDILLDYGSGYGRVAQYLLPDLRLQGYIGVDSAYEMLSLFKNRYEKNEAEQRTPLMLLNADIHTLPLVDNSVDVAIVCAVFLHNHKDVVKKAMLELKRVLKPGGTLLVYSSFPRAESFMGLQGYAYQALLNVMGKPFKNGPVRYYGGREVARLFKEFSEVKINPVGFMVFPKTIIILPKFIERIYRTGFANPANAFLEKLTPNQLKHHFASHYDVVAKL